MKKTLATLAAAAVLLASAGCSPENKKNVNQAWKHFERDMKKAAHEVRKDVNEAWRKAAQEGKKAEKTEAKAEKKEDKDED
ncbi:MAG: hypothetical protein JRI97_12355 [Deltaproteobacteria bacterium]|nr:hypothetical protein [Deltaproteobacteria bacterium]